MKTRPYQQEAIDATLSAMRPGKPQLVVLPTGTGKSLVSLMVATGAPRDGYVLFCVHRLLLIKQTIKMFADAGWRVIVEQAHHNAYEELLQEDSRPTIVVASMSSMVGKRLEKFRAYECRLLIVDEAHRTLSQTYRAIMKRFERVPIVGLTATPQRKGLGSVWGIAYQMTFLQAVEGGWLARPLWATYRMPWDWRAMRAPVKGEDVSLAEQVNWFEGKEGRQRIGPAQRVIRQRLHETEGQGLVFAPGVKVARAIARWLETPMLPEHQDAMRSEWRERGKTPEWITEWLPRVSRPVSASCITAETPDDVRDLAMRRIRNGTLKCIVNVDVMTEGVDVPGISHVFLLIATRLVHRMVQMVGRGSRPDPALAATLGDMASADERKQAIAGSNKPHFYIEHVVPSFANWNPATMIDLVCEDLPALQPPIGSGTDPYDGDIEDIIERLEAERLEREDQKIADEMKAAMMELERQPARSPFLVDGRLEIETNIEDRLASPTDTRAALDMTWDEYHASAQVQLTDENQFNNAKRQMMTHLDAAMTLTWTEYKKRPDRMFGNPIAFTHGKTQWMEFLHDRGVKADRKRFQRAHGVPITDADWRRWRGRRAKSAVYRPPGKWKEFEDGRQELMGDYLKALEKRGIPLPLAERAARALNQLSVCWSGRGLRKEIYTYREQWNPDFTRPDRAYAKPNYQRRAQP